MLFAAWIVSCVCVWLLPVLLCLWRDDLVTVTCSMRPIGLVNLWKLFWLVWVYAIMAVNCSLVLGCFASTGLRFSVPPASVFVGIYRERLRLGSVENVQKISGLGRRISNCCCCRCIGMRSDRNGFCDRLDLDWHEFGYYLDKIKW